MITQEKLTIINDPIYGFITIPSKLVFDLMEHPYFQRLRRISQMGMTYLVYPGANHTRFHHALGAMFLMQKAVQVLRSKRVEISEDEAEALYIAILLHDIGHGPFSHAMEHSLVENVDHEAISLLFMEELNNEFGGKLSLAITIFNDDYPRKFLNQLVSGQLDMDRLDYIRRDSFYSGVSEGSINSERLIAMLNVFQDKLVVDEKGIYSVEKFIIARRLMYWQVYLHKTGLVAEQLLVHILKRAKELFAKNENLPVCGKLDFFLRNTIDLKSLNVEILHLFAQLDDYDIICSIKQWAQFEDFVLSTLCAMLLDRKLLKIKMKNKPFSMEIINQRKMEVKTAFNITKHEASFFVFTEKISNQAYNMEKDAILMLTKSGKIVDVAKASDQLNLEALSKTVVKYYLCYPKNE